jgi:hypothetical protein
MVDLCNHFHLCATGYSRRHSGQCGDLVQDCVLDFVLDDDKVMESANYLSGVVLIGMLETVSVSVYHDHWS